MMREANPDQVIEFMGISEHCCLTTTCRPMFLHTGMKATDATAGAHTPALKPHGVCSRCTVTNTPVSCRKKMSEREDAHGPAVDDIQGAVVSSQAAAACQVLPDAGQSTKLTLGTRNIPLAAWAGARLGLPRWVTCQKCKTTCAPSN